MSNTPTPALGSVITNAAVRRIIYAVYVIGLVALGALTVGFAVAEGADPEWIAIANAVFTYLGIPVGGLALVNVVPTAVVEVVNDSGLDSTSDR